MGTGTAGSSGPDLGAFSWDPLVSPSSRITLTRPDVLAAEDAGPQAVDPAVQPWNLRRLGPPLANSGRWSTVRYDHLRQLLVHDCGRAVLSGCDHVPMAGPPTAPTTPPVDGEDPPSSEDWNNDYAPDEADGA